jgi:toxin YoeB
MREYAWLMRHDLHALNKVNHLIEAILEAPTSGLGKPEPLKDGEGRLWSRRIDQKNRLIYKIDQENILLLHCRGHYKDH